MQSLIIFAGKAGTGKTTLARFIAKELGIAYIDYDTLCQPFLSEIERKFGLGATDRYGFYRVWREPCYNSLVNIIKENLELGTSLIVSAPFTEELKNPRFPEMLKAKCGKDLFFLLCQMSPSPDKHFKMMQKRNSIRDEDFIKDKERFNCSMKSEAPSWDKNNLITLTSGDFEINKNLLLKRVETLRRNI